MGTTETLVKFVMDTRYDDFPEEVIRAGFFDEQWKKPLAASQ